MAKNIEVQSTRTRKENTYCQVCLLVVLRLAPKHTTKVFVITSRERIITLKLIYTPGSNEPESFVPPKRCEVGRLFYSMLCDFNSQDTTHRFDAL